MLALLLTFIGAIRRLRLARHTGHHLLQAWSQFNVATSQHSVSQQLGHESLLARTEVSRGPAPHRAVLLMTSCSAPARVPGFSVVASKEEAAFQAQMQTAVCFLRPVVTHAGTSKLLLCLDSLSPNSNLGKAALSSLSARLRVAGAQDGWGDR